VAPEGTQVGTDQTQAAAVNTDALRNAAQNPVASLISVPIQDNFNFNIGPSDRTQNVLNIQPVIPITLNKNWNLIVRWITPIVYQPIGVPQDEGPTTQNSGVYGLGDMNPTFFISPKKSKVIWGLGPTFVVLHLSHGDPWVVGQGSAGSSPSHPLWRQRYGGLLRLGQARKDPVDQSASRPVG